MPQVICKLTFPDDEPYHIRANAMVLARHYAKKAVKAHWQSLGHKLRDLEGDKLYRDANTHLAKHPELIALATERYSLMPGPIQPRRMEGLCSLCLVAWLSLNAN